MIWAIITIAIILIITAAWAINEFKLTWVKDYPIPALSLIGVVSFGTNLLWPLTINRTVNTTQVYTQQVKIAAFKVVKPSGIKYPPLSDPKEACKGKPVVIVSKFVSGAQGNDKTIYTWMQVRPAGDEYTVACHMAGDYAFNEGDLVILNGNITG